MTLTFAFVGRLNIDRRLLKQSRYWCRAVLALVLTLPFNDGVDDDNDNGGGEKLYLKQLFEIWRCKKSTSL